MVDGTIPGITAVGMIRGIMVAGALDGPADGVASMQVITAHGIILTGILLIGEATMVVIMAAGMVVITIIITILIILIRTVQQAGIRPVAILPAGVRHVQE